MGHVSPGQEILDMTKQVEQTVGRKVGKQQSFITLRSVPASKFLPWTPGLTPLGDGVWLESCGINKSSLPKLLLVLVFVMATVTLTEFVQIIIWLLCMVTNPFKSKTLTSLFLTFCVSTRFGFLYWGPTRLGLSHSLCVSFMCSVPPRFNFSPFSALQFVCFSSVLPEGSSRGIEFLTAIYGGDGCSSSF